MFEMMKSVLQNKKGQGMVEYGLIIGLIAVVLVAALQSMEGGISATFAKIVTQLPK